MHRTVGTLEHMREGEREGGRERASERESAALKFILMRCEIPPLSDKSSFTGAKITKTVYVLSVN